ncbi:Heme oxygenase [Xanthomonas sacchari]|uniref:biliverdin-producing heme oxygenase n=1 Tax=Xanthomonas sacchari TaxID=56458 RepID=UPI002251E239|nr:biliverdin-producing heme oxygenase [Xanthomonas sacchari]MCW0393432.1 Heme oxygenase [Xanthomonas sacchari]MCW0445396.1 Heme oxygenase [Xanthomonas sacchari]
MMSPPDGTALPLTAARLLREATAQQHQAVEDLPAMRALMDPALSLADYVQVLRRHHAVLASWEQREAAWLRDCGDAHWQYQPRTPLLAQDLHALRAAPPAPPAPQPLPPAAEAGTRWGMLYVVEGSRLGGRVIARHLRQTLAGAAPALSYFELGHADPAAWRHFQQRLERALPSAPLQQAAVDGARAMFAHFHTHFALEIAA